MSDKKHSTRTDFGNSSTRSLGQVEDRLKDNYPDQMENNVFTNELGKKADVNKNVLLVSHPPVIEDVIVTPQRQADSMTSDLGKHLGIDASTRSLCIDGINFIISKDDNILYLNKGGTIYEVDDDASSNDDGAISHNTAMTLLALSVADRPDIESSWTFPDIFINVGSDANKWLGTVDGSILDVAIELKAMEQLGNSD